MIHGERLPAKRMLAPIEASSGLMKGQAALEVAPDLVPGFSASGQDVWLERDVARASTPGIVLSAVGARCGKVFMADFDRWGTVANTVSFGIAPGFDLKYVHYVLNNEDFWIKGGAAQPYVMVPDSLRQRVWVPQHQTQRAIADYLDEQTARIDALIAKQEEMVRLLGERRRASIAMAIRSSDVYSAGHSRAARGIHVGQIKNAGDVTLGKMLQTANSGNDVESAYLRAANVQPGGALVLEDIKSMWFSAKESKALDLRQGDVVVVEGGVGGFGRAAFVPEDLPGVGFQNSINRVRPRDGHDGRYLAYSLNEALASGFTRAYCNVVSMPHLTSEKLAAMPVHIPSPSEQRAIADRVDAEVLQIDALVAKTREHIALAKERRSALITAAVTGQIDVRTASRRVA